MVKKYFIGQLIVQRYGHLTMPRWYYSDLISTPTANQVLLTVSISSDKLGYIYGFYVSASEGNDFEIVWVDVNGVTNRYRIVLAGKGNVQYADVISLNEGLPAQKGSNIQVVIVNAGSSGSYYKVGLLVGEVSG